MKVVVIFFNVGGYHAARLRAAQRELQRRGGECVAVEIVDHVSGYPWGRHFHLDEVPLHTLVRHVPGMDREGEGALGRQISERLPKLLDRIKPDVVAVPGWGFVTSRVAIRWCRKTRVPAVMMSESKENDARRYWLKEKLKEQFFVRYFDAALVGGKQHREYLLRLGMKPDQIFIGYDVVDNDFFASRAAAARLNELATRSAEPTLPETEYFLVVTRMVPRKNLIALLDAYRLYRQCSKIQNPLDLVICGDGEERSRIERAILEFGLIRHVHLPGFIPFHRMPHWFSLARALVHPALIEQWGLVLNEAAASSLPILCSKTVGAAEVLINDGENGLLFDPARVPEIRNALVRFHQARSDWPTMGKVSSSLAASLRPSLFGEGLLAASSLAIQRSVSRRLSRLERSDFENFSAKPRSEKVARLALPPMRRVKYEMLYALARLRVNSARRKKSRISGKKHVFIVGCGRSGTTLLGRLLSLSPAVKYYNEPYHLWAAVDLHTDVLNLFGSRDGSFTLTAKNAGGDKGKRFANLFREVEGKIVVEKTPVNIGRLGFLSALAPGARLITIRRDGLATAASIARLSDQNLYQISGVRRFNQWWGRDDAKWKSIKRELVQRLECCEEFRFIESNYQRGACQWVLAMLAYSEQASVFDGREHRLAYEDLVTSPLTELARLADFLDLPQRALWMETATQLINESPSPSINALLRLPPRLRREFNRWQDHLGYAGRADSLQNTPGPSVVEPR